MDILVAYDVDTRTKAGVRRLGRVARTCGRYGVRVQDSVFECRLSATRLQRLVVALNAEINARADSVHLYRFAGSLRDARVSLGRPAEHEPGEPWIL
jgi:CRISPR-associated protein Cas2